MTQTRTETASPRPSGGPGGAPGRFAREVVSEMNKVLWPSRKELAPDAATQQALRFLLESGEATELSPDVIVLTESLSRMREIAREFLRQRGKGTVSEIRQAIGASRRIVVPLLERLDREGVTRREGDYRVLKEKV